MPISLSIPNLSRYSFFSLPFTISFMLMLCFVMLNSCFSASLLIFTLIYYLLFDYFLIFLISYLYQFILACNLCYIKLNSWCIDLIVSLIDSNWEWIFQILIYIFFLPFTIIFMLMLCFVMLNSCFSASLLIFTLIYYLLFDYFLIFLISYLYQFILACNLCYIKLNSWCIDLIVSLIDSNWEWIFQMLMNILIQ